MVYLTSLHTTSSPRPFLPTPYLHTASNQRLEALLYNFEGVVYHTIPEHHCCYGESNAGVYPSTPCSSASSSHDTAVRPHCHLVGHAVFWPLQAPTRCSVLWPGGYTACTLHGPRPLGPIHLLTEVRSDNNILLMSIDLQLRVHYLCHQGLNVPSGFENLATCKYSSRSTRSLAFSSLLTTLCERALILERASFVSIAEIHTIKSLHHYASMRPIQNNVKDVIHI